MPEVAALSVSITGETSGLDAALSKANQSVSGFGSQLSGIGAAAGAALAGVGVAAAAGLGSAVKTAMDFEKQMSAVGAVAGASAQEMEQLTSAALQLGKDTSFSAKEAAQGIEELVKAGVSIQDVIGGGARAALDLAAAGAIGVGDAAEIASNAMNVFGKSGSEMAHVADVIAGAANASAIGVNDYKFSLSAAGAVAATVGISFESLSTAIAAMGNAGIKGSDAGTSLKTMMLNLQPTTKAQIAEFERLGIATINGGEAFSTLKAALLATAEGQKAYDKLTKDGTLTTENMYKAAVKLGLGAVKGAASYERWLAVSGNLSNSFFDAEGKAKPFAEIAEVLQNALAGMTKEQKLASLEILFGADAVRAAAVMAEQGAEGFEELAAAMGKVTAKQVAEERLNNLAGSIEKLTGSLETGAIILGGLFTPALKMMVDALTDGVNEGIEILEQLPDAWRTIGQVMEGAWEPSDIINPFVNEVGKAALSLKAQFGPAIQAVSGFLTGTLAPAIQAVGNFFAEHTEFVIGFVTALGSLLAMAAVQAVLAAIGAAIAALASPIGLVTTAITLLVAAWVGNWGGIRDATLQAWAAMEPTFAALVDWLGAKIPPAITWISETGWPGLVAAGQAVGQFITGTLVPAITDLIAWLGPKLQPVVTWLSGTGWPGLTAAMQEGQRIGLLVIKFVQDLWAELEKRGIVDGATQAFTNLHAILEPVFNVLTLIVGVAAKVIGFLADLAVKGLESGAGVKFVADQLERFFAPIADGLATLGKLIEMLRSLGNIQMPSWWGSNPFGGGSGGSSVAGGGWSQLSWRGAGAANPNASQADVEAFAYQAAKARGWSDKDARELVSLISGEGAGQGARALGDSGRSFGPMQLFTGGGLGNRALDAGLNVRDPSTWQQQILFGMETIEREGAGQWSVARNRGLLQSAPVRVPNLAPQANITGVGQSAWGVNQALMTPSEAAAACGPYAAFLFAQATGRTPNPREAEELARLSGWTEAGMGGTGNFMNLLGRMGVRAVRDSTPTEMEAINAGSMVGFSTPEHYFVSRGYDPSTGKFNVGETGTAMRGGSAWMSYDEIARIGGGIQDIIALAGQMGPAFEAASSDVLTSVTTLADGSQITISQMGSQIMATVTDSTGQVVASYGTMTTAITEQTAAMTTTVPEQMNLMTSGALVSVTNLGTGVQTVVSEMSGTTIATVTDMQGNVTSQYAQLANGAQLQMGDMANGVLTSVTDMGQGMITTVQDANGNIIATVTDAAGNVTSQYTSMAQDAGSSVQQLASESIEAFESIVPPAEAAVEIMEAVGDVDIPAPDVGDVIDAMEDVEDAAKDALDAIKKVSGKGGEKGGDKDRKDNPFAKRASGGPVDIGRTYLVGEEGPELFTASRSGYIVPNDRLSGASIDYDRLAAAIARAIPRQGDINVYGVTPESTIAEAFRRQEKSELMYLMRS